MSPSVYSSSSPYGSYWTTDFGGYVDVTAHPLPVPEPTIPYARLLGSDRFDTAIKISQADVPQGSAVRLRPGARSGGDLPGSPLWGALGRRLRRAGVAHAGGGPEQRRKGRDPSGWLPAT